MKIWQKIALGCVVTAVFFMGTNKSFGFVKQNQLKRDCDAFGCGGFGDGRGARAHAGTDILFKPGEAVLSPISGEVIRYPFPYGTDLRYTGILIRNEKYEVKMFYVENQAAIGLQVKKGQIIATAQNIAAKYGSGMQNHVHVEVRDRKTNELINPEILWNYETMA